MIGQTEHRWVMPRLPTGATYDLLTLKLLEPDAERFALQNKEEYVPDNNCRLTQRADNRLPKRVKYSFIHSLRRILFSYNIYVSQNMYLHEKMWKYVFLGDIKLYLTNNRSNLKVTFTFMSLNI
jgi:hypothetical protein